MAGMVMELGSRVSTSKSSHIWSSSIEPDSATGGGVAIVLMRFVSLKSVALFVGGWVLIASAFSGLLYSSSNQLNPARPADWKNVLLWQIIVYAWAALFPFIVSFAIWFRFERDNWWRLLPLHLLAAVLFVLLHTAIYVLAHQIIRPEGLTRDLSFLRATGAFFVRNWTLDLAMYSFILSTVYVVDFYRRYQREQIRSSELKAALSVSQLQALKMQLHPHFLFNTLNTISALMHDDVAAADRMVARLGDFLRLTLENSGEHEVTLEKEMEFIDGYLEIESVRFGDRLTVLSEIEPQTMSARIPNLILQPIIENAIQHGISRQSADGQLIIRARESDGRLQIQVEDNGPGTRCSGQNERPAGTGIGLSNTRARLEHFYGTNFCVNLSPASPHGTIVSIDIPFKVTADLPFISQTVETDERVPDQSINS